MSFCGWNTKQTYCIAQFFNARAELFEQARCIVVANPTYPKIAELFLKDLCERHAESIYSQNPELWQNGKTLDNSVDWTQVREHFELD